MWDIYKTYKTAHIWATAIRKDLMSPHIWENRKNTVKNLYYYVLKVYLWKKNKQRGDRERRVTSNTVGNICSSYVRQNKCSWILKQCDKVLVVTVEGARMTSCEWRYFKNSIMEAFCKNNTQELVGGEGIYYSLALSPSSPPPLPICQIMNLVILLQYTVENCLYVSVPYKQCWQNGIVCCGSIFTQIVKKLVH